MYKITTKKDNVEKLEQKLFKEIHIKERDHLQEWIAKNPEMLGEELLIIQKEFDGFNETNERLDLLAIDKKRGLVIIENKLDDTGRNVVWQALKYTSYCSTLKTEQIIKMYQSYLDKLSGGEDAKQNIIDFLEINDEEFILNENDQRIIFVANHYRKEVTSTVMWLLKHDIQIQCFKVTPYAMEKELFLQVDQIIPIPEINEFMIEIKEKEKEEKGKREQNVITETQLIKFWSLLKNKLTEKNINYLDKTSAKADWNIKFYKGAGRYGFCIGKNTFRVEILFHNDLAKQYFEAMLKYKSEIEKGCGRELEWENKNNNKSSSIKYEMQKEKRDLLKGKFNEEIYWEELIEWYTSSMVKFYNVVNPYWEKVQKEIKG